VNALEAGSSTRLERHGPSGCCCTCKRDIEAPVLIAATEPIRGGGGSEMARHFDETIEQNMELFGH
jgi:hypothetical protein